MEKIRDLPPNPNTHEGKPKRRIRSMVRGLGRNVGLLATEVVIVALGASVLDQTSLHIKKKPEDDNFAGVRKAVTRTYDKAQRLGWSPARTEAEVSKTIEIEEGRGTRNPSSN